MPLSNRKFGCEIELKGISRSEAIAALESVGLSARDIGYAHNRTPYWKIVNDASVDNGFECVSPVLYGESGLAEVRKAAQALKSAGATVGTDCGFHVHCDANDLSVATIMNIAKRYAQFEAEIDAFMPRSRRGNSMCQSMSTFYTNYDRRAYSYSVGTYLQQYSQSKDSLANFDRYFKVNVAAYGRHGTVEYRQHSGTMDADKMVNWITFCLGFTEASILNPVPVSVPAATVQSTGNHRGRQPEYKLEKLYDMFVTRGSLTVSEIAAAFEWSESSVQVQISKLRHESGCEITTRRGSYTHRYTLISHASMQWRNARAIREAGGTVAQAPRATPATTPVVAEPDTLYRGIDAGVRSFYVERTLDLA